MYTRVVDCNISPEKIEEFKKAIYEQVLPAVKDQPGFVDLIGMVSETKANHGLVISFWNSKADAERFYRSESPMFALLRPFLEEPGEVEHYYVDTSTFHKIALGKAA